MNKWKITIIILMTIVLLGAVTFYFLVYNKPHTDYENASADLEINAADLYQAFIDNEQAAQTAYIGKIIIIDGTVGYIEEHETMVILGFTFQDGLFGEEGIRCTMLENHHEQATSLSTEQQVRIKGLCAGFSGHDVIMEYCSVVD